MSDMNMLGRLIVAKRGKKGIRAIAKEIGVSPATISRLENGDTPNMKNFMLVCRWLGTDLAQAFDFQPARPVSTTTGAGEKRIDRPVFGVKANPADYCDDALVDRISLVRAYLRVHTEIGAAKALELYELEQEQDRRDAPGAHSP